MDEKRVEMQQKFEERISQAVTDGKLTQEQANMIIAKKADGTVLAIPVAEGVLDLVIS